MHQFYSRLEEELFFSFFLTPHALTPGDPTWNPCTVMRTVSPTFALVGDMKSLGPFGAAETRQKKKRQRDKGHRTERGEQILSDTCFVTEGERQIQFPVN